MMAEILTDLFRWAVHDVIFFSGDVQTTTIAVAITSSLCCSIVVAVAHVITQIFPAAIRRKRPRRNCYWPDSKGSKVIYNMSMQCMILFVALIIDHYLTVAIFHNCTTL